MLSLTKKYLNITVTVIFLSSVEAAFTVAPRDTEAAVGDNATLYCSSSLGSCRWYHWPLGAHGHEIVFQQGYIYNGYTERFSVIETNNVCNLQIESVSIGDAGLFTCMETSTKAAQKTAELVVFEQFPSDKTCTIKISCAPTCNDLELSCAMQSYGNFHPIVEWSDGDGKQINSTLSEDKAKFTVHLKKFALQPLTYICQVKYPSKSLSSKYMWSFSMPANLEDKSPVVSSTTEQSEQKKTVPIVAIVGILAFVLTNTIYLFYIIRNKRKLRKLGNNPETGEKKTGDDRSNRPQTEENCHPAEKISLLDYAAVDPPSTTTRNTAICGLDVQGNEGFVVTKYNSIAEGFDLQSKNCTKQWKANATLGLQRSRSAPASNVFEII